MEMPSWGDLVREAEVVVEETVASLPPELRQAAAEVPVVFESFPSDEMLEDGLDPDILGLFLGQARHDTHESMFPRPPQIVLFLENLSIFCDEEGLDFAEEVRTTYLHELGHYLGLEEDDLTARELD